MEENLHRQTQVYCGRRYSITDLIYISSKIKTETVDIRLITNYTQFLDDYDITDFVNEMNRVMEADISYPILIYRGFVMDGKHRLAKSLFLNKKTIKVKILKELPIPID